MTLFQIVETEQAIVSENGTYKQADLYQRDGLLYAKIGSGYVRLYADGTTTKPKVRLDFLTGPIDVARDVCGRLCIAGITGSKPLTEDRRAALLGEVQS